MGAHSGRPEYPKGVLDVLDFSSTCRPVGNCLGRCHEAIGWFHTAVMGVSMIGSFALLALAMRTLPLGTAYVIWTGIGAVGAFLVGIMFLGEAVTATRICAAVLIIAGLITMKLA